MVDEDGNVLFHRIIGDWWPVPVKVTREALEDWAVAHRLALSDSEEIFRAAQDDIGKVATRKIAAEAFDANCVVWITSAELNG